MTNVRGAHSDGPRVLWFYGADAVGKSTIAWEAYSTLTEQQVRVAYLDTDYLSFCSPKPSDRTALVAANLQATWSVYQAARIDQLVISGIVVTADDRDRFIDALRPARVTFCRLTAAATTIRRRIVARREAEAATQDVALGPELRAELDEYGDRSVGFAELLDGIALEDFVLATDGRSPRELAADAVARYLGVAGP